MYNIQIDKKKAEKKWSPIIESLGINEGYKKSWMSEYAEYHQLNENAYANNSVAGMGAVVSPQPGTIPGASYTGNGTAGSGDLGQQLIAASMKVAAQTIGLDLVPVKPSPGPVIDLYYVDYRYDDTRNGADEKPIMFKIKLNSADQVLLTNYLNAAIVGVTQTQGGLTARRFVPLTGTVGVGGATAAGTILDSSLEPTGSKEGNLEFLGYSRIDGQAMFRSWQQYNTASAGNWSFDATKNTFDVSETIQTVVAAGFAALTTPVVAPTGVLASATVDLVSAIEDQLPGYSSNWNKTGMPREQDEDFYPGIIAPNVSTKRITVGTIEISSALKRTEMEDIKAQTGMDIVQKLESVLVNELSQVISRQIVDKVFELGTLNRASAPQLSAGVTIFDLNTNYVLSGPQGETTHAVQRKLVSKLMAASNFIASEGRIGPATYIVTNGRIAAALADSAAYTIAPVKGSMPMNSGQLYPVGQIANIQVYVDPYMKYDDNRIALGRKNEVDQPGIVFVPYLMAQSISLISEATRAPRLFLRSRYSVAEIGFYPNKQFMVVNVTDQYNYLV